MFRAPPDCPGVERQFLEPSTTKSSSLSRARGGADAWSWPPVVHELAASLALFQILRVWTDTCVNVISEQPQQQQPRHG